MITYKVATFRNAGLQARWIKNRKGAPMIAVRDPNSSFEHLKYKWWAVDKYMFETMSKSGVREGFVEHALVADIFSIPI